MIDLCDAVQSVGSVSAMVSPSWVLHLPINWATAVGLLASPSTKEMYTKLQASHVRDNRILLEVFTTFPSLGAGAADWVLSVRQALKIWEAQHPGLTAIISG